MDPEPTPGRGCRWGMVSGRAVSRPNGGQPPRSFMHTVRTEALLCRWALCCRCCVNKADRHPVLAELTTPGWHPLQERGHRGRALSTPLLAARCVCGFLGEWKTLECRGHDLSSLSEGEPLQPRGKRARPSQPWRGRKGKKKKGMNQV